MTWSERIKLAWTTFKREALPLYGWTLIFTGVGVVLIVAMVIGVLAQIRQSGWAFPRTYGGSFSPGMPVPGIPPTPGLNPYAGPFGSPNEGLFGAFSGPLNNFSHLLSVASSLAGTFLLILIVGWLIGSAFYTGLFNLTAKAYHENVSFKDFRFTGFSRILGWQGFLLLIKVFLTIIGLIGALSLSHSRGALVAFLILYALFITAAVLFALPWLFTSTIYLLVHRKEGFWDTLKGSWKFFQRHMGVLWGYIGTVILIEAGLQILSRISAGLTGIATLVVSPFIAVLAIVWVLSLEDDESPAYDIPLAIPPCDPPQTNLNPDTETPTENPHISEADNLTSTTPSTDQPISLKKPVDLSKDKPHFCPSCGKKNTGTAYCPQCGTKLDNPM
ncbi:MAG: zinc ribbon domain-containing protein [Desulfosporosinus sp.]|nr:zinc ribbon domain-containing protein [Desulfosporosinus sp.]